MNPRKIFIFKVHENKCKCSARKFPRNKVAIKAGRKDDLQPEKKNSVTFSPMKSNLHKNDMDDIKCEHVQRCIWKNAL